MKIQEHILAHVPQIERDPRQSRRHLPRAFLVSRTKRVLQTEAASGKVVAEEWEDDLLEIAREEVEVDIQEADAE
jgi:hypothetical protein